ncbi:hypothetical protein [Paenibacillus harenae]|nr:hypothetical protein [Paenibacillus harenae]
MEIDGRRFPIENRTIIFLRPGEPHAYPYRPSARSHPIISIAISGVLIRS